MILNLRASESSIETARYVNSDLLLICGINIWIYVRQRSGTLDMNKIGDRNCK